MQPDTRYELDTLQSRVGRLEGEVENLDEDVKEIKSDVKQVLKIMDQAQGSWKTLVIIGGIAGAIGAAVTSLLPFTGILPK